MPATIAIFELADGETAVVASEPFGGLVSDPEWRRDAPGMATRADEPCDQLARALGRLQQTSFRHHQTAVQTV